MEIIDELEPTRRGPYGGAVGYVSYSGNLDSCITIRTVVCHGERASIQVGRRHRGRLRSEDGVAGDGLQGARPDPGAADRRAGP